jgi:hypothetical protein
VEVTKERRCRGQGRTIQKKQWTDLVQSVGEAWQKGRNRKSNSAEEDFRLIANRPSEEKSIEDRWARLAPILIGHAPLALMACWAFLHKEITTPLAKTGKKLAVTDLLCNQDHLNATDCQHLWPISQALLTLHAIADVASVNLGITAEPSGPADRFAEQLLFGRDKNGRKTQRRNHPPFALEQPGVQSIGR